jgi:hypothetical protein
METCWGTHWELEEHIGNPLGIWCEHIGNNPKKKKNNNNNPDSPQKGEKAPCVHASSPHWLPIISLATCVLYHFLWPRLMQGTKFPPIFVIYATSEEENNLLWPMRWPMKQRLLDLKGLNLFWDFHYYFENKTRHHGHIGLGLHIMHNTFLCVYVYIHMSMCIVIYTQRKMDMNGCIIGLHLVINALIVWIHKHRYT